MESQPQIQTQIDLTKCHPIAKIQNAFLHQFSADNSRELLDICQCQILQHINIQGTQIPSQYLKLGSFVQRIDDCIFVIVKFQNLITYIFQNKENPNSLYFLSFQTYNCDLQSFSQTLKQSTHLVEYKTDNYDKTTIKQKVLTICGEELTQNMIENVGSFDTILKSVGSILGSVAKNVSDPTHKAEIILNNSVHILSQKYVSEQNKTRWNMIKQSASNLNEKMTEMYKPIDNAVKWVVESISESFNKSQNKYIKNVKKIGLATAKTLNNSYKRAEQNALGTVEKENQSNPYGNELHQQSTNNLAQ